MLEVRNLTKIYKTKGGQEVKALDDVSVRFPETGMVFLLGKSGSGKSTLLNVCGGLDSPTSGEILVKDRSSKDFSQSDFDSYRNTFVGFIFQEYNILNEFSVEDNIALALELQGKPKDKKAIAELLEEVDLTGYAKRKPNTLSGGQKQRIAIARALIKAPEIIMADEPTGALDSATGKQVFDTLKKLSAQKLVLVVSHDRDFAELYGDRVIELKDGKIISDVSKTEEESRALSENLTALGSTLCVKDASALNEADFDKIKTFLRSSNGNVMIAGGERDVKAFKEATRITEDGGKEVFRNTDENTMPKKEYAPEESKFIRSRLPLRHAVKIGISGLKSKPIRLFFTVLLCTVAFVMFGLLSTMMLYDGDATFKQTLKDSSINVLRLEKNYTVKVKQYQNGILEYSWDMPFDARFTQEEFDEYIVEFGTDTFAGITHQVMYSASKISTYYNNNITTFAYIPEHNGLRAKLIEGSTYPKNANEICISSYTAEGMIARETIDSAGKTPHLSSVRDLIGKKYSFGKEYTITGIFDCGNLPAKYDGLKENSSDSDYSLMMDFEKELEDGLYLLAFLSPEGLQNVQKDRGKPWAPSSADSRQFWMSTNKINGEFSFDSWEMGAYYSVNDLPKDAFYLDETQTTVGENQIIVSTNIFFSIVQQTIYTASDAFYAEFFNIQTQYESYLNTLKENSWEYYEQTIAPWENYYFNAGEQPSQTPQEGDENYEIFANWQEKALAYLEKLEEQKTWDSTILDLNNFRDGGYWTGGEKSEFISYTLEEKRLLLKKLTDLAKQYNPSWEIGVKFYNTNNGESCGATKTFTLIGCTNLENYPDLSSPLPVYVNDATLQRLWEEQKGYLSSYQDYSTSYKETSEHIYDALFLPFDGTDASAEKFLACYKNDSYDENDTRTQLNHSLIYNLETINEFIDIMSKIFLWAGIILAIFSALLLSNFISVSISQKKREIGILRAVGARGLDVFKIFFSESFFVSLLCVILAIIASFALCQVLNAQLASSIGASIFVFGILSLLLLVGIALLTAIVATFLPVWNTARKKPVDSIRSL